MYGCNADTIDGVVFEELATYGAPFFIFPESYDFYWGGVENNDYENLISSSVGGLLQFKKINDYEIFVFTPDVRNCVVIEMDSGIGFFEIIPDSDVLEIKMGAKCQVLIEKGSNFAREWVLSKHDAIRIIDSSCEWRSNLRSVHADIMPFDFRYKVKNSKFEINRARFRSKDFSGSGIVFLATP